MADKEELCITSGKRIVELRSLTDLIKAAFRDVFHKTIFFGQYDPVPAATNTNFMHTMSLPSGDTTVSWSFMCVNIIFIIIIIVVTRELQSFPREISCVVAFEKVCCSGMIFTGK